MNLFTPFFVYKSNVINYGYMREDKMKLMISKFDYGLIILGKNNKDESLYKFSFPSKIFTYLETNIPILSICPEDWDKFFHTKIK